MIPPPPSRCGHSCHPAPTSGPVGASASTAAAIRSLCCNRALASCVQSLSARRRCTSSLPIPTQESKSTQPCSSSACNWSLSFSAVCSSCRKGTLCVAGCVRPIRTSGAAIRLTALACRKLIVNVTAPPATTTTSTARRLLPPSTAARAKCCGSACSRACPWRAGASTSRKTLTTCALNTVPHATQTAATAPARWTPLPLPQPQPSPLRGWWRALSTEAVTIWELA